MDITYDLYKLRKLKLKNLDDLKKIRFSTPDDIMVFVSGCFDFLHAEHIDLLAWARNLGDYLVIAINSDKSIKKLKGEDRPFISLSERITMLIPNIFVDYITPFNEKDITKILKILKPQIFAKGRNYVLDPSQATVKKVPMNQNERKIIENYSGKIYFLNKQAKYSSSEIIRKFKSLSRILYPQSR